MEQNLSRTERGKGGHGILQKLTESTASPPTPQEHVKAVLQAEGNPYQVEIRMDAKKGAHWKGCPQGRMASAFSYWLNLCTALWLLQLRREGRTAGL